MSHHDDAHAEGPPRVAETVWSGGWEVFVDRAAAVARKPADFAIHFTDLSTGLPAAVEEVTLRLTGPAGEDLAQQGEPGMKGIFTAAVLLAERGDWKLTLEASSGSASLEIPWKDIRVFGSEEEAEAADLDGDPSGVTFLKEEQWKLGVLTERVERRPMSSWKSYPALVKPRTNGLAHVVPSISGRLLSPDAGALPRFGERVEAGQVLARVDPPLSGIDLMNAHANHHELETHEADLAVNIAEAEAGELRTRAALELAEESLARVRGLAEAQAKSERELQEAEYEAKIAATAYRTAVTIKETYLKVRDELHAHPLHDTPILDRLPPVELRAPISGRIDAASASLGEYVTTDNELFVVVDASSVYVEARVPERDVNALEGGARAFVRVADPGYGGAFKRPLEPVHVGLRVDERRRVPLLYLAPNEDDRLRLGMMVEVEIETSPPEPRIVVPQTALVDDRGVEVVFVALGGEAFERRPVTVGVRESGHVEIRGGLTEGERVVTRGAYLVRLASLSSVIPGHQH